ncbi:MAG: UDP-glucose--hexose-1-phosphate uridylyltransferase [Chloroflexota bacterium]
MSKLVGQTTFDSTDHTHLRHNPLTDDWVVVAPHRTKRPWQGQVEKVPPITRPEYDPDCYLCPGNTRAGGKETPHYTSTYVFDNDFASLLPTGPSGDVSSGRFFRAEAEVGICRVMCFNPRHDLTLPEMTDEAVRQVVDTWAEQVLDLGSKPFINYVQLFENKGEIMGCSNPHPHGQIWGNRRIPDEPAKEDIAQRIYFQEHGSQLLFDYLADELEAEERILIEEEHWVALIPYWAVWPYETMLLPKRPVSSMPDLHDDERTNLARTLKRLLIRYDNLFETSFPYSMGWHGQPTDGVTHPHWQLHAHFYPPLLRSATIKKFMVGYEMLGMPQRDLTAEKAAEQLRALSEVHYKTIG